MSVLYESFTPTTGSDDYAFIDTQWYAQTFTPLTSHSSYSVKIKCYRVDPTISVTLSIKAVDGDGKPTGADLVSKTLTESSIPLLTGNDVEFIFPLQTTLQSGTTYGIVVRALTSNIFWNASDYTEGTYTGGAGYYCNDSGATWFLLTDAPIDMAFKEYGPSAYPVEPLARVTNLIHRYEARRDINQLEISVGDITSILSPPFMESAARATADKQRVQDNTPIIDTAVDEATSKAIVILKNYWNRQVQPYSATVTASQPVPKTPLLKELGLTQEELTKIANQPGIVELLKQLGKR